MSDVNSAAPPPRPASAPDSSAPPGAEAAPGGAEDRAEGNARSSVESALTDAGAMLGSALLGLARVVFRQGRVRAKQAAATGRVRLDLRQLRRDRDVMYQKLGREVVHLQEGGELQHPGLARGVERIREIEARIAEVEADLARQRAEDAARAADQADPEHQAGEPGASLESDPEAREG